MKVREVMTPDVAVVRPETPLRDVAQLLVDRRISGVPVVDAEDRLLGVLSEGDFVRRAAASPGSQRPRRGGPASWVGGNDRGEAERLHATTAGTAMTTPAIVVQPDRDLSYAAKLMTRSKVNRLPVVEDGRVIGIVTRADIVRAFARGDDELLRVLRHGLRGVDGLRVVAVHDGVAVLAGIVAHPEIARTVRTIVEAVEGIVGVDDADLAWLEPDPLEPVWPGMSVSGRPY